ncbi:MAG TPA: MerR family transcriptional regulator [Lacipirellulaceae bacterium]|jgi:DNA-binding transcriptional MerR regulator|nr:MerR family transcriptional regulator [Lacipirellulaceae bacterium]
MAYTVKQVAAMSGVSVRTLHFYDETSLLKPAYYGANGYRFYEEPQLLTLQQILFYRELGFELKQIKDIVGRADFEKVAALQSHREVLEENVARILSLLETIDKTIHHLKGTKKMKSEEMFVGFSVAAGEDRFDEHLKLGGQPVDCKVSAKDTDGAMCIFEFTTGWPCHLHHEQDEWVYVVDGELALQVGEKRFRAGAGESIFIPRKVAHLWGPVGDEPCKVINIFQPAGKIEEFLREVGNLRGLPTREEVINRTYTDEQISTLHRLFGAYDMELLPPPPGWPGSE